MGLICYSLIRDTLKENFEQENYVKLREEILIILYPNFEKRLFNGVIKKVKQTNYESIREYYDECQRVIKEYSILNGSSKRDSERKMEEFFMDNLGNYTILELKRNMRYDMSILEIMNYLEIIEKEIVLQGSLKGLSMKEDKTNKFTSSSTSTTTTTTNNNNNSSNNNFKHEMWCKIHKSPTHKTKDCIVYDKEKDGAIIRKREEDKKTNMIIKQFTGDDQDCINVEGTLKDKTMEFLVDSGATGNYINETTAKEFNLNCEESNPVSVRFGNGLDQRTNIKARAEVKFHDQEFKVEFFIIKDLPVECILGNEFLKGNGCLLNYRDNTLEIGEKGLIISFNKREKELEEELDKKLTEKLCLAQHTLKEDKINIFKLYKKNNRNLKVMKVEPAKFHVSNNIETVQSYGYSIAHRYIPDAKKEIKRLLDNDIIERSNSRFSSPGFFIEKRNKDLRLVIDYKKINKYIDDDPWMIPKIEECIRNIGSNKVFSQIDLTNGFNQIPIHEDSRQYTAFVLLGNHYQYKRIPFGIKPGPKMFQRYISSILEEFEDVFVYIDDIVLYSKSEEEHINLLDRVLTKLYEHQMQINFEKSKFFAHEIEILGYRVNEQGIYPRKIYLENNIFKKDCKTRKDIQSLLGVLNWYRKFVPDMSRRIYKVTEMLKTDNKDFKITEEMKKEIENIKEHIATKAKLDFPNYKEKFTLQCDASELGIGAVLIQETRIIGYFSKKFHGSELNYTIVEKEYLAILLSLLHFKNIIQGYYIEVQSDSNNCVKECQVATSRINKWKLLMNDFNYDIKHIPGDTNVIADGLSRCFYAQDLTKKEEYDLYMRSKIECDENNVPIKDDKNRYVIKENEILKVLERLHVQFGHKGLTTMYYNLKSCFYVKDFIPNIKKILQNCKKCQDYKIIQGNKNLIKCSMTSDRPFERVSTDIYGPFSLNHFKHSSEREVGYILSITDVFTKYTRLFFESNVTGKEVCKNVEVWIKEQGECRYIISDNGKQYVSKMFEEYLKGKSIKHVRIPEYTPSSNGISERINQTITFMLAVNKGKNIKEVTQIAEDAINFNYNKNLQLSPYAGKYGYNFYDLDKAKQFIKPNIKPIPGISKFKIGDIVLLRRLAAKKLDRKYGKPQKVIEIGKYGRWYRLEGNPNYVHVKSLKLYRRE